jgi:4'-phosphopantetheinyl transferase
MLSEALPDVGIREWRFVRTPSGRPILSSPAPWVSFSLSHAKGLVACAVSREVEVGIDAEAGDRGIDLELLARDVCSVQEQDQLRSAPPDMRNALFLDLWTLKEAYLKALGVGIASALLQQISFDLSIDHSICTALANEWPPWHFVLLRPTAAGRVSLAVRSEVAPAVKASMRVPSADKPLPPVRTSHGERLASK